MAPQPVDRQRWDEIELVVLDIEGTISSISFVKDVLYPYALNELTRLARDSWDDAATQDLIQAFPAETRTDADTLIAHVQELTAKDIKAVYLKQLQGHLWQTGYTSGRLLTPLFPDVLPVLRHWHSSKLKTLAIFSSGSIHAQRQFFSYVKDGAQTVDLKPLFKEHFDTVTAGPKNEVESYVRICERPGNAELTMEDREKFPVIRSLEEVAALG
ncbi:acireductone synthase-like protein [Sporormia fimetaria CBS 119925]|uniref:Acireductone synthase-like protein n=1 Tax=Sporormia fimetaria CBS 119925 TaxID=1340428 RepID=A0A6A6V5R4_9PLEO|nr:acireductone synthase-like protein [Sporormia fimetaria CBS 119925]